MSLRPDLGPKPRLGYCDSRIERAAELRIDAAAIDALARKPGAGAYVIGGEWIVMKKGSLLNEPLFTLAEANALSPATETIFLGVLDGAPRFGHGLPPQTAEALKSRGDLHVTDLPFRRSSRSRCARSSAADRRSQGGAALACTPPLLLELRQRDQDCQRRLAARLPAMQG